MHVSMNEVQSLCIYDLMKKIASTQLKLQDNAYKIFDIMPSR